MRTKLKLSIAMATYNGERYLQKQLESFLHQTRMPDELVVSDDASSDRTLEVLYSFAKHAPFKVRIYRNKINLGPTKNFEKAINLCEKDIIFLSDQDDVWMSYKVEQLYNTFLESNADYAFSNAMIADETLHSLGYTMWESILFTARQQRRFEQGHQVEILLKHNVVTGATMAFRAELRERILPIPDQWVHDAWIALLVSAEGARGIFIREPLVKYRQHPQQLIGGQKTDFSEKLQQALFTKGEAYAYDQTKFLQALNRLSSARQVNKSVQKLFETKIRHLKAREVLYGSTALKRLKIVLQELLTGRYHKFSNGWRSIAKDLFIAGRVKIN